MTKSVSWVKAPAHVFNDLADRVRADVEEFEALPPHESSDPPCGFRRDIDRSATFTVSRIGAEMRIDFMLEGRRIVAQRVYSHKRAATDRFIGDPVLRPDGGAGLEVNGQAMELWQFSRLVLESFFFPGTR